MGRRPAILHILHDLGGGVESHVSQLVKAGDDWAHGLLRVGPRGWRFGWPDEPIDGDLAPIRQWGRPLDRLARQHGFEAIHLHHPGRDGQRLLQVLRWCHLPFGVSIHDHFWICPRMHLLMPGRGHCGAPQDISVCRRCLALEPAIPAAALRRRHETHARLLAKARFLACPNESLRQTMARHFPSLHFERLPHGYRPPFHMPQIAQPPAQPLVVAVIGALGEEKGGLRVERLAEISRERRLPLRWVVIGDTLRHGGPQELMDGYLHVHGSYRLADLPDILARHSASVAAFPGRVPETWCLTLDEAWACGLPAMVPDIGALGERVNASGAGWVITDWEQDEAWLEQLLFLLTPAGRTSWEKTRAMAADQMHSLPSRPPVLERYSRLLAGC